MDDRLKMEIILVLFGVIIGASGYLANSFILWTASVDKEKSDIAEGLYLDVSGLEERLVTADREFTTNGDKYIYINSDPFYTDKGLYYVYQRDIPKIDRKISNDTFVFYAHILSAERYREQIYQIQRYGDTRMITNAELKRQEILTEKVAQDVNISVVMLTGLKRELNEVAT
jgi:hypothetical protein